MQDGKQILHKEFLKKQHHHFKWWWRDQFICQHWII